MSDTQLVDISRFPVGTSVVVTGDSTTPNVVLQNANGEPARNRGFVLETPAGKRVATLDGRLHDVEQIKVIVPTVDQVPPGTIVQWTHDCFKIVAEISTQLIERFAKEGKPLYIKIEGVPPTGGVFSAGFIDLYSGAHITFSDIIDEHKMIANAYDHDIMDVFFEAYLKDAGHLEK